MHTACPSVVLLSAGLLDPNPFYLSALCLWVSVFVRARSCVSEQQCVLVVMKMSEGAD